jgi:hypothetical protein
MGMLLNDLKAARTYDAFNDVCLIGTDGGSVPASRMRSQVFLKMFYGPFKESESLGVPLPFRTHNIEQIVQYCYSDEAGAVRSHFLDEVEANEARDTVHLRNAADFFALPELHDAMTDRISSLVVEYPVMACTVLAELSAVGEAEGRFGEICLGVIQAHGKAALLPFDVNDDEPDTRIRACSPEVL